MTTSTRPAATGGRAAGGRTIDTTGASALTKLRRSRAGTAATDLAKSALRSYGVATAGMRRPPELIVVGAKRGGGRAAEEQSVLSARLNAVLYGTDAAERARVFGPTPIALRWTLRQVRAGAVIASVELRGPEARGPWGSATLATTRLADDTLTLELATGAPAPTELEVVVSATDTLGLQHTRVARLWSAGIAGDGVDRVVGELVVGLLLQRRLGADQDLGGGPDGDPADIAGRERDQGGGVFLAGGRTMRPPIIRRRIAGRRVDETERFIDSVYEVSLAARPRRARPRSGSRASWPRPPTSSWSAPATSRS